MAGDIGAGEATLAAKVAGGASAGVAWGSFVTLLLLIPAAFGAILSPFAKKANTAISEKIESIKASAPAQSSSRKQTKAEREYNRRMEDLNRQREEAELQERLANLQRRKASKSSSRSAHVV